MRTVTNCFLLNLTVADLLFAVTKPALAYVRVRPDWPFGDFVCRLLPYSQYVCGFMLLWTLTLISMDRYRCIVVPPYRSQLTPCCATVLTVLTWLIALTVFMPVPFWFHEQAAMDRTAVNVCTPAFPKNDAFKMFTVFTVSVVSLSCILDPTEDRALGLVSIHGRSQCIAEQSAAAHKRFHTAGFDAARRAPVQEARASGARAVDQRDRGAGNVAAGHRRDVHDLRGRQSGHAGHGLLPAVSPLHRGSAVRAAQHRRQPHPVWRAVLELPRVFRPAVVHIEGPADHVQGTVGQRHQGRRSDAQQRPLQLDLMTGKFGVRGRASGHRYSVVVCHQRVLVMRCTPPRSTRNPYLSAL